LAYNSLPYNEDIIDGETGFLYSDPKEFEEKLEFLILNPLKRKLMADKAYEWVWKYFNMEDIAKDYEFLFNSVIKK
jgi:glycosyltransferase involved in cell wall biosynthesis